MPPTLAVPARSASSIEQVLRRERRAAGESRRTLASRLEISARTVGAVEEGRDPARSTLRAYL